MCYLRYEISGEYYIVCIFAMYHTLKDCDGAQVALASNAYPLT